MKKIKFVHSLLIINILVFSGFGIRYLAKIRQESLQDTAIRQDDIDKEGHDLEGMEAMSKKDYAKIYNAHESIAKTGRMDDAYLDWCLQLMERPAISAQAREYIGMRQMTAIDNWELWKEVTPQQRDKVFRLASKYLTQPDGQFDSAANQFIGASMVSKTKDTRAIPLLVPLCQSRYSSVRPMAQVVLKNLQRLAAQPQ